MRPIRSTPPELVTMPLIKKLPTKACNSGSYKYGRVPESYLMEYLKGKNVIIVGPAGYLHGKGLGKWIDSFNVVVRINHAIPVEYPEDYGTKTDILYHILSHRGKNGVHKRLVERWEVELWSKKGLKWLVSRHESLSRRVKQMETVIDGLMPWVTIHRIFYRKIQGLIGNKNPNTGVIAMMHLLTFPITKLQVTGFDFYESGVYEGYGDVKKGESAGIINSRWHDSQFQIAYLKKVKRKEHRLMFDEVLTKICER